MAKHQTSFIDISFDLIKAAEEGKWSLISDWLENGDNAEAKKKLINKQKNNQGQRVLHIASQRGQAEIVKKLLDLEAGAENFKDNKQMTPFETACLWAHNAETVAIFLKKNVKVDDRALYLAVSEGNMETINLLLKHDCGLRPRALYLAVSMERKKVVRGLLKLPDWRSLMRYTTEKSESDTKKTEESDTKTVTKSCFCEMIRKMPDVAEEILNRCTELNPECYVDKEKFKVEFNYEFIEDVETQIESLTIENPGVNNQTGDITNSDIKGGAEQTQSKERGQPKTNKQGPSHINQENHPISIMVQHERLNLLAHPLVASLLYSKWQRFGSYLYVCNLLTYCLFLLLLTIFAFVIKNPQYESCMSIAIYVNGTDIDCGDVGISTSHLTGVFACAVLVLLMAAFRLALEVIQICSNFFAYIKNWINYLEIVLYLTSIIFVWVFHFDCLCPSTWQWQLGVVAVFLGWANLIVFVSNIPFIGIYVLMFSHIFFTFLKVLIFSLLLIVMFGFTFYFAFTQPDVMRSPFSSPQRSLLKVLTMTTGEFEFDSMFRQDPSGESDDIEEIPFLPISVILWIVFIVIMPILFTNLLIGLAVGDISEIKEKAEVRKLIQQAKLLLSFEEVLRTFGLRHRFALQHKIVQPFEKLGWYDKLKLQLWGGERYCSRSSLDKVVSSQNYKAEIESLSENQMLILELKHSIRDEIRQLVMAKDAVTQTEEQVQQ